jgi:vancomycin resistance protein YoaR
LFLPGARVSGATVGRVCRNTLATRLRHDDDLGWSAARMIRRPKMFDRRRQHGAVLLGVAGGMLVVAGGLAGAYYTLTTRHDVHAATRMEAPTQETHGDGKVSAALAAWPQTKVTLKTATGAVTLSWAELGAEVDSGEVAQAGTPQTASDLAALAKRGALPIRIDMTKAVAALTPLRGRLDHAAVDAYLDLEAKTVHADAPGSGVDTWGSVPRLEAAARQAATTVDLAEVAIPARITKDGLGIADISTVLGTYTTHFPVSDSDRNFNLKLAASKLNGVVLKPGAEFSFNGQVGERSEKEGYKIAHVITAGEMVDGLAGGTCQISTTLFGASFFAGMDIVKISNHSRPSAYTPLGFDATVVWPDTDLKLRDPYDFPVAIHYRVANGEALVEILGQKRPYDKVTFERAILQEDPFPTEERLDDKLPDGQSMVDQKGLDGFQLTRIRRFFKEGKQVKEDRWSVTYKPVTEYVKRGTNTDPDAKMPPDKDLPEMHPDKTASYMAE